jgi:hypothetical protein
MLWYDIGMSEKKAPRQPPRLLPGTVRLRHFQGKPLLQEEYVRV